MAPTSTLVAEAGCVLQRVQEAAAEHGLLFALSLAAEGSCTIGGNLATNAGGTQVVRYGNAREQCLGLEVVTAEGRIWDGLSGLRKDNTGYDLRDLLIGSEGTLGIITGGDAEAAIRGPRRVATAMASLPTLAAATSAARARARAARRRPDRLRGDERALARSRPHAFRAPAPAARRGAVDGAASSTRTSRTRRTPAAHVRVAARHGDGARPRRRRGVRVERSSRPTRCGTSARSIPLAQAAEGAQHQARHRAADLGDRRLRRLDRRGLMQRVSRGSPGRLRPSRRRQPALQRAGARRRDGATFVAALREAHQRVRLRRGGRARRLDLGRARHRRSSSATSSSRASRRSRSSMMRAIKNALDPAGVLNPGRVLRPEATP